MTRRNIWLLKLVPPVRYGRLLLSVFLLCVLLPFFYLGRSGVDAGPGAPPAFFFSVILAYIIPVFSFITARSKEALRELRPTLNLGDAEFDDLLAQLGSATTFQTIVRLSIGIFGALAHTSLLNGSLLGTVSFATSGMEGFMSTLGTIVVWLIMTTVIYTLTRQAILFGRLGRTHVEVSLFASEKLLPFARVSISSSLAIIGALALFPLISFEGGLDLAEILPGAIAALGPMAINLVLPVWPVHLRLLAAKKKELALVGEKIALCNENRDQNSLDMQQLAEITPLLVYRREVAEASTWPFDVSNIARFAFYLIIPPLTWLGAALIENLVDSLL